VLHTTVVQIRANKEPLQLGTHNLDDRLLLLKEQKNINKSTELNYITFIVHVFESYTNIYNMHIINIMCVCVMNCFQML